MGVVSTDLMKKKEGQSTLLAIDVPQVPQMPSSQYAEVAYFGTTCSEGLQKQYTSQMFPLHHPKTGDVSECNPREGKRCVRRPTNY